MASFAKKLDRILVNDNWVQRYSNSYGVFESGGCSDHLQARIHITPTTVLGKKPFKFSNVLISSSNFLPLVSEYWDSTSPLIHSTSTLFRLSKKLKELKPELRIMGRNSLNNIQRRTKLAFEDLCAKQNETLLSPGPSTSESESKAYSEWMVLSEIEEGFLKQRSKLHWLSIGDQNNAFFYRSLECRFMINSIRELLASDGSRLSTIDEIKSEAVNYFETFLNFIPDDYSESPVSHIETLIPFRCTPLQQAALTLEVSAEEIRNTLFSMPSNKSPGPDGFTSEFYKATWSIIGHDFICAIQSFFQKGFLPKGINSTVLALIRKKPGATNIRDYRPISCCNIMYKVITKILANRLSLLLPNIISSNQTAFVKNRALKENVLLASELVKNYHKTRISPRCAIKFDISKAFDSLQWPFLLNTLEAMRFPSTFIAWIKLCISTASYSVQINGELGGYFQSKRGLRQGCPLSPYLFVICLDVLSHMLNAAVVSGRFGYHLMCKGNRITHLCFADDLLVFSDGKLGSVEGIMETFKDFTKLSGLHINLEKSVIHSAGINPGQLQCIIRRTGLVVGSLPVRYLGLPLLTKRMTKSDYTPLLEKIKARINGWTNRFLSYAGRAELIRSVIGSLLNFWLSAFQLPKQCLTEIEKICNAFFWSGASMSSSKAKVAWTDLCKPKSEGGLGFRNLHDANKVTNLNLIWRILSNHDSLWVNWTRTRLLRGKSFWSHSTSPTLGSWTWRKLTKLRDLAKSFHKIKVQNGLSTSFWFDNWFKEGPLINLLGQRGTIDLGVPLHSTVDEAINSIRTRSFRSDLHTEIYAEVQRLKDQIHPSKTDIHLWRSAGNVFKPHFNAKSTLQLFRPTNPLQGWYQGIWFPYATPKFSFISWLAMLDRLPTGRKIQAWNPSYDDTCMLCSYHPETRDHLFFDCNYSMAVWAATSAKLMHPIFSPHFNNIIEAISRPSNKSTKIFLLRYCLQCTIYHIWRERNNRRHDKPKTTHQQLIKTIDKNVRNRLSSLYAKGVSKYKNGLEEWFKTR